MLWTSRPIQALAAILALLIGIAVLSLPAGANVWHVLSILALLTAVAGGTSLFLKRNIYVALFGFILPLIAGIDFFFPQLMPTIFSITAELALIFMPALFVISTVLVTEAFLAKRPDGAI